MASIYPHGVYVSEQETSLIAPIVGTAGLQVIIGTAPVNMLVNPEEAVNKPLLVYSYKEAVMSVGYSDNFEKYTLCESINANFQVVNTAPLILINVLDPKKHSAVLPEEQIDVTEGIAVIAHTGVLVDKLTPESVKLNRQKQNHFIIRKNRAKISKTYNKRTKKHRDTLIHLHAFFLMNQFCYGRTKRSQSCINP